MDKAKIMIVEDEALVAKELEYSLEGMGYAVTSSVTFGEEAVAKVAEDRPDIVLAEHRPERLARLLGRHTGHEPADLISWAIAHAAIAATWNISNGGTGRHPLTALGHLFRAQTKL